MTISFDLVLFLGKTKPKSLSVSISLIFFGIFVVFDSVLNVLGVVEGVVLVVVEVVVLVTVLVVAIALGLDLVVSFVDILDLDVGRAEIYN